MTRAWFVILFGAAAAVSCNDPDIVPLTQLNLDRPIDMAFACYGPMRRSDNGMVEVTAQPPLWCNEYSPILTPPPATLENPPKLPPGVPAREDSVTGLPIQPLFYWYGFILQSASGTVALARWEPKASQSFGSSVGIDVEVRDADPRTPGKNAISVGENPIAIATDLSGCHEVTANAGSCDLSVIDINSAVAFDQDLATAPTVNRMTVTNTAGVPIRARPAAMVAQPSAPELEPSNACGAAPTGLAYVAYPGCGLVAGVDLTTGRIQQAIKFTGTQATVLDTAGLAALTCNDECAIPGTATADVRPVTLDLRVDPREGRRRLAIGADNSSTITVFDLDAMTFGPVGAPLQIALEDPSGKLGVTTIRLTPQIAMGNSTIRARRNNTVDVAQNPNQYGDIPALADAIGASPGGEGQYVYAVATDGTVRVADVLAVKKECDTQIDMRFVRELAKTPANIPKLQCFPVGDTTNPPRRTDVKGPGIRLLGVDGAPTSVAIFKGLDKPLLVSGTVLDANGNAVLDGAGNPVTSLIESPTASNQLIGYFAIITETSGHAFVVNIDDDDGPDTFDPAAPQATAPVLLMAHQLRDSFSQRGAVPADDVNKCTAADPTTASTGGPRVPSAPLQIVSPDTLSTDATKGTKALILPSVHKQACRALDTSVDPDVPFDSTVSDLQIGADVITRDEAYPDLRSTRSENWLVSWEGPLSNDTLLTAIDGPQVRTAQMSIDSLGLHLTDTSRPYCEMGVEPFDVVQLRGCNPVNGNAECPSGYTCFVHEDNLVTGLGACMLTSEAPRLAAACKDFLTSARRYTVSRAESGELTLLPRKHVLATTPIDGCVDHAQCKVLADYAEKLRNDGQPFELAGTTDSHTWQCRLDSQRAPVNDDPTAKRCIEVCAKTDDCEPGSVCIDATGAVQTDGTAVQDGTCMESVAPSQSCINGPQRFSVHAGEAFTMVGLASGYIHSVVERGGDGADKHVCEVRKTPGSLDVGRIPLHAPPCADPATVDPATGAFKPDSGLVGFEPNPCSTTVTQVDDFPNYVTMDAGSPNRCTRNEEPETIALPRQAPAIKLRTRSMTLTMVDPYAPGDAVCIGDRAAGLGKIPQIVVAPLDGDTPFGFNYRLSFDQRAGYLPLPLAPGLLLPAFPVKVLPSPGGGIWVLDNGDFLATRVGEVSTKGRVYRVELLNLSTTNVLQ